MIFTQGNPQEKRKARCLTIFLENFYSGDEIKILAAKHLSSLKAGKLDPNKAALLTKAIAQSRHLTFDERDELIRQTLKLSGIHNELKRQLPLMIDEISQKVSAAIHNKDWKQALRLAKEIEQEGSGKLFLIGYVYGEQKDFKNAEKYYHLAIKAGNANSLYNLANLYHDQRKFEQAETYYLLAIDNGDLDAFYNLAVLYHDQQKFSQAEKYYLLAAEQKDGKASNNLANMYYEQQKFKEAQKYYLLGIKQGDIGSIYNLANMYYEQQKFKKAEEYYLLAIEHDDVSSFYNLAYMYHEQQKLEKSEKYYLLAIEKGHPHASYNLANIYVGQERFEEAERYYLSAIQNGDVDSLCNLAILYKKQQNFADAEKFYLLAIEKGDKNSLYNLAIFYIGQNRFSEAELYFEKAISAGIDIARLRLAFLFYTTNKNKLNAKELLTVYINKNTDLSFGDEEMTMFLVTSLWVGDLKSIKNRLFKTINQLYNTENKSYLIKLIIYSFLIHKQTNLIVDLFVNSPAGQKLLVELSPLYYASIALSESDKSIMLKIPPEINKTVNDIIKDIQKQQELYYGTKE